MFRRRASGRDPHAPETGTLGIALQQIPAGHAEPLAILLGDEHDLGQRRLAPVREALPRRVVELGLTLVPRPERLRALLQRTQPELPETRALPRPQPAQLHPRATSWCGSSASPS